MSQASECHCACVCVCVCAQGALLDRELQRQTEQERQFYENMRAQRKLEQEARFYQVCILLWSIDTLQLSLDMGLGASPTASCTHACGCSRGLCIFGWY